jgi:cell division protein FtsN
MRTLHRQHGGTFVGIIIGLIIGLGIALAVAVAITKTPMPFTNKTATKDKPEKPAPAVDVSADPNKPLYGNRVRPKDVVKNDSSDAQNKTADGNQPDTVAAVPKKVEIKAAESKDPIKDIIASKTEAKGDAKAAKSDAKVDVKSDTKPAEAKNDSADVWTYFLQTGAFNDQNDAEGSRAKLALMGVEAHVSEKPSPNGSGVLYRVRVGPFAQLDAANKVRGKLSDNGVNATLVRIAK